MRNLAFKPTVMIAETKIPARDMRANVVREGIKRMIASAAVGWMFCTFGKMYIARLTGLKSPISARNQDCCWCKSQMGWMSGWESSLCQYGVPSNPPGIRFWHG